MNKPRLFVRLFSICFTVAAYWLLVGFFSAKPPFPVPHTGQTSCFDPTGTTGTIVPCEETGQDGELRAGAVSTQQRFVDNDDGTITDMLTGLIWLEQLNCVGTHYPELSSSGDGAVTWQQAFNFVSGLNDGTYSCGTSAYRDWRVPHLRELLSLVDYSQVAGPSFPFPAGPPFVVTGLENVWTSTTWEVGRVRAYVVGAQGITSPERKTGATAVWPVRGPE